MGKQIMAVDDSPTVRQVLQLSLEEAGYIVVTAADGEDALVKLVKNRVDLIVTDLEMPRMDGVGLIREVRSQPGYRFIPIIMLSSESFAEKKQAGKVAGASGWVNKPFRPEQLLSVVRAICPV